MIPILSSGAFARGERVPLLKRFSDALRSLFGASAPAAPTAVERAAQLERKILKLVDDLPAMPVTAVRALKLLEDPDVALTDLAELVHEDVALTTALLQVANSALFAGGAQALRLEQAVVRLGLGMCRNLITAVGVRNVLRSGEPAIQADCRALWHHGVVTASLCSRMNRTARLGFGGEEYVAGMLHDLGRVLIALADRECTALAGIMDSYEEADPTARERVAIGADHCGLGAWFAELSGLPASLIEVIRHHHAPDRAATVPRLVALVAAADHLANHMQRRPEVVGSESEANAGLTRLTAGWAPGRRQQLLDALPKMMIEVKEAAASDLG